MENFFTHEQHSFLTCRVNCHTQSMNWMKTGERSASVWFLSPWPMRLKTKQKNRGNQWCNWTGALGDFWQSAWKFVYQLEAVTEAQPLLLKQHLKTADGAVVTVQHEHGQGRELACAVPTVATVHHHWGFPRLHLVCDPQCSCHDQLQTHTRLSISLCYFPSSLYIFHSIFFFFYSFVIAISGTRISFRIHKSSIESYLTYNNLVNRLRILIHLLVHSRSNALLSSPWCAQASVWTPDWRASGSPRCWGRPHPSACGVTLSWHGCCEYPRTPAQHFDRHPHFHNHHPSSEEEKTKTSQVRVEKVVFLFFF